VFVTPGSGVFPIDNGDPAEESACMSTGVAKTFATGVLVLAAVVIGFLVFGNASTHSSSSPVATTVTTTAPAAPVTTTSTTSAASVNCPPGTLATSTPGPVPAAVAPGYMWTPAGYPTAGWCEVRG
jgi:hypothetical protein